MSFVRKRELQKKEIVCVWFFRECERGREKEKQRACEKDNFYVKTFGQKEE